MRLSAAVAHATTAGPELLSLSRPVPRGLRRAVALSLQAQGLPAPPQRLPGPWRFRPWLAMLVRRAALSPDPSDWLRILLYYTLLPEAFNDPLTGADRSLGAMVQARWRQLDQRQRSAVSGHLEHLLECKVNSPLGPKPDLD